MQDSMWNDGLIKEDGNYFYSISFTQKDFLNNLRDDVLFIDLNQHIEDSVLTKHQALVFLASHSSQNFHTVLVCSDVFYDDLSTGFHTVEAVLSENSAITLVKRTDSGYLIPDHEKKKRDGFWCMGRAWFSFSNLSFALGLASENPVDILNRNR